MCLALPAEVVAIHEQDETATVSLGGVKKEISLLLVEKVKVGDYVLIHVGYALGKISEAEARCTLALFAEAGLAEDGTA